MLSVNIQPKDLVNTRTVVRARVYVKSIELFNRVIVGVEYCDSIGILFDGPTVVISGEDYAKWANDDTFIVNYVYEQIGIVIVPEPAPAEEHTFPPAPAPTQSEEPAAPTQSEEPAAPAQSEEPAAPTQSEEPAVQEPAPAPTQSEEPAVQEPAPAPTQSEEPAV